MVLETILATWSISLNSISCNFFFVKPNIFSIGENWGVFAGVYNIWTSLSYMIFTTGELLWDERLSRINKSSFCGYLAFNFISKLPK